MDKPKTAKPEKTFRLDGAFIKHEAKEALKSYFFPFFGLYAAATGQDVIFVPRDKNGRIMSDRKRSWQTHAE